MLAAVALVLLGGAPAWPLSAAELEGKPWVYDARVDDSPPCAPGTKGPIALRLFAKVKQLRLTVKNCTGKTVKLLHDSQLQPSRLKFAAKVKAPFDERTRAKLDPRVYVKSFLTLQPGQARVLADESLTREGEAYSVRWGPFRYEGIKLGKQKVKVALDAWIDEAADEARGKKITVEGAVVGSFTSNEVTVALP